MKKQRQKWVCFLAVLTLVLAVLCACGTQPEQEEEPAPVQETEPKGTEASAGNTVDMGAVSYTHLDVYKRQLLGFGRPGPAERDCGEKSPGTAGPPGHYDLLCLVFSQGDSLF